MNVYEAGITQISPIHTSKKYKIIDERQQGIIFSNAMVVCTLPIYFESGKKTTRRSNYDYGASGNKTFTSIAYVVEQYSR